MFWLPWCSAHSGYGGAHPSFFIHQDYSCATPPRGQSAEQAQTKTPGTVVAATPACLVVDSAAGTDDVPSVTSPAVGGLHPEFSTMPIIPGRVKMRNSDHEVETYAFLDPGSLKTFMTEQLMARHGSTHKRAMINVSTICFGSLLFHGLFYPALKPLVTTMIFMFLCPKLSILRQLCQIPRSRYIPRKASNVRLWRQCLSRKRKGCYWKYLKWMSWHDK